MPTKVYKRTEETRQKISEGNIRRYANTDVSKRISNKLKGRKLSEETKQKMSLSHKGINTWAKGKNIINRKLPPIFTKEHRKNLSKSHQGNKHWNWKDGITPINIIIRNSLEMKLFKKACLERDNFTDQKTGIRGGNLVVHHINNFADFSELRTSISNGITLSVESHKLFHKKYGKKNNSREQLIEFLNNNIC